METNTFTDMVTPDLNRRENRIPGIKSAGSSKRIRVFPCNLREMCAKLPFRADILNAVYFRRGLTCTVALTNDLIDGGQPRAKNGF